MRINVGLLFFGMPWFLNVMTIAAADEWERASGFQETAIVAMAIGSASSHRIIAASRRAVYESTDDGQTWNERFRAPAQAGINTLAMAPEPEHTMLVGTDHGLYGSLDGDKRWLQLFHGVGESQQMCRSVAFHPAQPHTVLLGTRDGLFISTDNGAHWAPVNTPSGARDIAQFAFDLQEPNRLYALTPTGLFVGNLNTGRWDQRAMATNAPAERSSEDAPPIEAPEEREGPLLQFTSIAVHPHESSTLYLGTSRGIRMSADKGLTWQWLPTSGLASTHISRILLQHHSPLVVYATTEKGVARYVEKRRAWELITSGLANTATHDVIGFSHRLWAATDQGLFWSNTPPDSFSDTEQTNPRELLNNFVHEPRVIDVQEAAIRYAEVHPDKIRRWRRQAALKALLPNVSLGMDQTTSQNIHVDEGTFPKFQLLETQDQDSGLKLAVTWQLGDLIWNESQTSIDARSRLMVELRNDIVDTVTRTYFERRRLQLGLLTTPPQNPQDIVEKELRVQELTALIDGLTGGYFSRQMKMPTKERRL